MLILGEADYRTPPGAGGEEMFRALKFLKRPVVMVRFQVSRMSFPVQDTMAPGRALATHRRVVR